MGQHSNPDEGNRFLVLHAQLLLDSYRHWAGRDLIPPGADPTETALRLYNAPMAVMSHDTRPGPIFNYANLTAQDLFEMDWRVFTALPSRLSAEPLVREERAALLERVARQGYIDDYAGVRVSARGRRFLVRGAVVWNLIDGRDDLRGQAAALAEWNYL